MKNFSDKAILNILAKSCEAVFLLFSSVIVVRYLSRTDYGTFLQVMLIVNTVYLLNLFGLPQSFFFFYFRVSKKHLLMLQTLLLIGGISLAASISIYLIRYNVASWFNNGELAEYGLIISAIVFFKGPVSLSEPVLLSRNNMILNSIFNILGSLLIFVVTIFGVVYFKNLKALLIIISAGYAAVFLAFLVMIIIIVHQEKKREVDNDASSSLNARTTIGEQLRYAMPIGISNYVGIIGRQIDQYLVSVFFTPMDFAVFSRGAMQIPIFSDIQLKVNELLMPKYTEAYQAGNVDEFLYYYKKAMEKVTKVTYPVFAFLFPVAPSIVTLLYTVEYVEAANILRIYLFFLLISITSYGVVFRISGKTKILAVSNIVLVSTNLILSLILIKTIGAVGAAAATILSSFVGIAFLTTYACKILDTDISNFIPWKKIIKVLVITNMAAVPVYVSELMFRMDGVYLMMKLVVEFLIYCYMLLFFMERYKMIEDDEYEIIERWTFLRASCLKGILFVRS